MLQCVAVCCSELSVVLLKGRQEGGGHTWYVTVCQCVCITVCCSLQSVTLYSCVAVCYSVPGEEDEEGGGKPADQSLMGEIASAPSLRYTRTVTYTHRHPLSQSCTPTHPPSHLLTHPHPYTLTLPFCVLHTHANSLSDLLVRMEIWISRFTYGNTKTQKNVSSRILTHTRNLYQIHRQTFANSRACAHTRI